MVLELHVWGPAFGLPSIDADCIAAVAYFHHTVPPPQWILVADIQTSVGPQYECPFLIDGNARISGFSAIISYLRKHPSRPYDIDYGLSQEQQTDRTAFTSFIQTTANPLIDLSLYVSSDNYSSATSSAYTAILPWYANYTIPPARRDLARARTAHLGLSSLDVHAARQDGSQSGSGSLGSEFEGAKRASGLPTDSRLTNPKMLSMGRGKGVQGLLSSPIYAARFRLDALTNDLLEPLSDLLGRKKYLLREDRASSLDCLAFAYLALMFYPPVPQAWLREVMTTKYPRITKYMGRMREELLSSEVVSAADVWFISSHNGTDAEVERARHQRGMHLPWRPKSDQTRLSTSVFAIRETISNLPLIGSVLQSNALIHTSVSKRTRKPTSALPSPLFINVVFTFSTALIAAFSGMAIHHRNSPRQGDLIFRALRPSLGFEGFEAGNILSVLAGPYARMSTNGV
ncbi:Tom37 C-terminal domain-domain-containing protein [Clohesyomyces aquaticus]|uniref:Tom37 C-terminal domain-domain-containing protein n=1 Tax=Clohesyomyces aquaticus TaxID=1231657 RepID=A0A1Y1YWS2_9PLEO|nr:Tom37 C-terminal domain-domain-containing protein [Clohesyomyces aquaticus]